MIVESKEELVHQLTETWNKLMEVDRILEEAAEAMTDLHKDIRTMIRQHNEQTEVRGAVRVAAPRELVTGVDIEDSAVHRVSDAPRKYTLRPGRDSSK